MFEKQRRGKSTLSMLGLALSLFFPSIVPVNADEVSCPTIDLITGVPSITPIPGINWSGCSLRGLKLSNVDLTGANLSGADFSPIRTSGSAYITTVLDRLDLSSANFAAADLRGASLWGSDLSEIDLTSAKLGIYREVKDGQSYLYNSVFTWNNVTGVDFSVATIDHLSSIGLSGTPTSGRYQIRSGRLYGPGVNMSARSWDSQFAIDLKTHGLSGLDLTGSKFDGTDLSGLDLSTTNLTRAEFYNANLSGISAKRGNFTDAQIWDSNLQGAQLQGANLSRTLFMNSNIARANLTGATLTPSSYGSQVNWEETICADGKIGSWHAQDSCLKKLLAMTSVSYPRTIGIGKSVAAPVKSKDGVLLTAKFAGTGCGVSSVFKKVKSKKVLSGYLLRAPKTPTTCLLTLASKDTSKFRSLIIKKTYYIGWKPSPDVESNLQSIQDSWPESMYFPEPTQACYKKIKVIERHRYSVNNRYNFIAAYREGKLGFTPTQINSRVNELTLFVALCSR